jgi:hypothetical protein
MKHKLTPGQKITLTGFAGDWPNAIRHFEETGNVFPSAATIITDNDYEGEPIICIDSTGHNWALEWFTYETNENETKD